VASDPQQEPVVSALPASSPVDRVLRIDAETSTPLTLDLWEYRELLLFLAWRDIAVRYKQTSLGVLWAAIQPALMMLLFTAVLGRLAPGAWPGESYGLLVLCGLVPWQLVSYSVTSSASSLVSAERLITKVYFPRLVIPAASVMAGGVDFAIAFVLLLGAMMVKGVRPGAHVLALPVVLALTLLLALAVAVTLSALVVKYRDVRHALAFLVQVWLLASPIGYPTGLLPERWRGLALLNPMTGIAEGFRWALLGRAAPIPALAIAFLVAGGTLALGLAYFHRVSRTLADVI
jgi:lipopolysaccharide transport system permease protein